MHSACSPNFNPKPFKRILKSLCDDPTPNNIEPMYSPTSTILNSFLYHKFSSSQNYYLTRRINEILCNSISPSTVQFKQISHMQKHTEAVSRFYPLSQQTLHLRSLTEYYKFHSEVPRLFMMPVSEIIHEFHDKKRRVNYIRITKMIGISNPENIRLHDTESMLALEEGSFIDHQSLIHMIPPELKQNRQARSPVKKDRARPVNGTDKSNSLHDFQTFLNHVFCEESHSVNFVSEKDDKKQANWNLKSKIGPKLFEKLKINFQKNANSHFSQKFAENFQVKSLKVASKNCDENPISPIKNPLRNSIFQNFKKNKLPIRESINLAELFKPTIPVHQNRPSIKKSVTQSHRVSEPENPVTNIKLTAEKQIKNLNINNLNINIHLRSIKNELDPKLQKNPDKKPAQMKSISVEGLNHKRHILPVLNSRPLKNPNSSVFSHFQQTGHLHNFTDGGLNLDTKRGLQKEFPQNIKKTKSLEKTRILRLVSGDKTIKLKNQSLLPSRLFFKTSLETNLLKNCLSNLIVKKSVDHFPQKTKSSQNQSHKNAPQESELELANDQPHLNRHQSKSKPKLAQRLQKLGYFRSVAKNSLLNPVKNNPYATHDNSALFKNLEIIGRTGSFNLNLFHTLQTIINKKDISRKTLLANQPTEIIKRSNGVSGGSVNLNGFAQQRDFKTHPQKPVKFHSNDKTKVEKTSEVEIKARKQSQNVFRTVIDEVLMRKK